MSSAFDEYESLERARVSSIKVEYQEEDGSWAPLRRPWPQSPNEYDEYNILGTLNGVPLRVENARSVWRRNEYQPEED